jgi:hypothetical protein
VVAMGNLDTPSGPFHQRFQSGAWFTMSISTFDTPSFKRQGFTLEKLCSLDLPLPEDDSAFAYDRRGDSWSGRRGWRTSTANMAVRSRSYSKRAASGPFRAEAETTYCVLS